jgi:large subunit ribosomal protein L21
MFAIVSIAGQQFKVEEGQQIFVHRLAANEGDAVSFDAVHLLDNDGKVTVGTPNVKGASIKASVLAHVKGDKVIVFHKNRRKGYRKKTVTASHSPKSRLSLSRLSRAVPRNGFIQIQKNAEKWHTKKV